MGGAYNDWGAFFLCAVTLVKWPSLVPEAMTQLRLWAYVLDPGAPNREWQADARRVEGHFSWAHRNGYVRSGVIWIAKRWKVLRRVMGQPAHGAVVFKFGCLQQRYGLLPENVASVGIGDALQRVRIASPALSMAASSQVVAASRQEVAMRCRGCGLQRGLRSGVWDFGTPAAHCGPLCGTHAACGFEPSPVEDAVARDVRQVFGMAPLMVSAMVSM